MASQVLPRERVLTPMSRATLGQSFRKLNRQDLLAVLAALKVEVRPGSTKALRTALPLLLLLLLLRRQLCRFYC